MNRRELLLGAVALPVAAAVAPLLELVPIAQPAIYTWNHAAHAFTTKPYAMGFVCEYELLRWDTMKRVEALNRRDSAFLDHVLFDDPLPPEQS
jgi:hypothetical protein